MTFFHISAIFYHYYFSLTIITFSTGLGEFKFDYNYNTPGLNTWTGDTLAYCGIWQLSKVAPQSLSPAYTGNGTWNSSTAKISTRTLVYYWQFSWSHEISIFHTVHISIIRTVALIQEIPHFIQFLTLSYNGHHSVTASSVGPRDSQFLTVPTSLIWRLLYNRQSLGNLSITVNSVVLRDSNWMITLSSFLREVTWSQSKVWSRNQSCWLTEIYFVHLILNFDRNLDVKFYWLKSHQGIVLHCRPRFCKHRFIIFVLRCGGSWPVYYSCHHSSPVSGESPGVPIHCSSNFKLLFQWCGSGWACWGKHWG